MIKTALAFGFALTLAGAAAAQDHDVYVPTEGDLTVRDFHFRDGETLPALRLHYMTLGTPRRDAQGHVVNAVLILHGTGGDGHQFLRPQFAGVLFVPGGLLDPAKYFIILADDIGHGKSSKPSDGLHMKFPKYDYDDMVAGEHALVHGLGIDRLRLILGTSMGCMHSFVWGETYPTEMDALMPLACLPVEIAGRNRLWRKMVIDGIEADPAWDGGEYKSEPQMGLRVAADLLMIAGGAPLHLQQDFPTRAAADKYEAAAVAKIIATTDANDTIYQVDASRNYNPAPALDRIVAPVMWINSGDDFINPPALGIAQVEAPKMKHARFVLLPESLETHGHGTHTWAAVWKDYLAELLKESGT